jgi:hypothetical protein
VNGHAIGAGRSSGGLDTHASYEAARSKPRTAGAGVRNDTGRRLPTGQRDAMTMAKAPNAKASPITMSKNHRVRGNRWVLLLHVEPAPVTSAELLEPTRRA